MVGMRQTRGCSAIVTTIVIGSSSGFLYLLSQALEVSIASTSLDLLRTNLPKIETQHKSLSDGHKKTTTPPRSDTQQEEEQTHLWQIDNNTIFGETDPTVFPFAVQIKL